MSEIVSALIGALTLATIALASWLAPRLTKKSRLLNEVRRLSESYRNLPESNSKARLGEHIESALSDLNTWLDPINRQRRALENLASWGVWIVAVFIILTFSIWVPITPARPWLVLIISIGICLCLVVLLILIDRHSTKRKRASDAEESRKASATRIAGFLDKTPSN
jgi:Flp pilus assembly protein TadB